MDTLYTLKDRNQRYYAAQVPGGRTDCPDRADTLTLDKVREVMKPCHGRQLLADGTRRQDQVHPRPSAAL